MGRRVCNQIWNGLGNVLGVLCYRKVSATMKRSYTREELKVTNINMSMGVKRVDRIKNKYISGTAHVRCFGDKVREARLTWYARALEGK